MNAYVPIGSAPVAAAAGLAALDLAAGFVLQFIRGSRLRHVMAWLLVVLNIAIAAAATAGEPPGVRMLVMIGTVLLAMKCVVLAGDGLCPKSPTNRAFGHGPAGESATAPLTPAQWLCFAAVWPGMSPEVFRNRAAGPLPGAARLIRHGMARAFLGTAALLLARIVWRDLGLRWLATPPLLVGLSLILHFGLFNVLAGLWRGAGVDCQALFRAPLSARTLGEFWARRWNLAFSEMTSAAVYRPFCRSVGRGTATLAAFLFSGALHELAISFPARAGYGLPMSYFALHGALVVVERRLAGTGLAVDRRPWIGRLWTLAWLALPLPLLFHRAFLDAVVWPLIGMEIRR